MRDWSRCSGNRHPNVAITVCARAAGETCPAYLGPAIRAHWGVEDPAKATGSEAEAAFDTGCVNGP